MAFNILSELSKWKKTQFSDYDMRMDVAVNSLQNGETPKIQFKSYHPARYNAVFTDNQETAMLTWAGIYAGGYDLDTGNLVPDGETVPFNVPGPLVQREVHWKCGWNHSIDTTVDRSLYNMQLAIEHYLVQNPSFNLGNKPRKSFQDGTKAEQTPRYTFQTRMFSRKNDRGISKDEQRSKRMKWHPWIMHVLEDNPAYYPNPEKPVIMEWRHGQFHDIRNCKPPFLKVGDVVWFSAKLTVHVTAVTWWTEFVLEEMVRVASVPEGVDPVADPIVDSSMRRRIAPGSIQVPQVYGDMLNSNDNDLLFDSAPESVVLGDGASRDVVLNVNGRQMAASKVADPEGGALEILNTGEVNAPKMTASATIDASSPKVSILDVSPQGSKVSVPDASAPEANVIDAKNVPDAKDVIDVNNESDAKDVTTDANNVPDAKDVPDTKLEGVPDTKDTSHGSISDTSGIFYDQLERLVNDGEADREVSVVKRLPSPDTAMSSPLTEIGYEEQLDTIDEDFEVVDSD